MSPVRCHTTHYCAGCDQRIAPGDRHLDHVRSVAAVVELVSECLPCARRNGRPGIAEPDVPEQPLDLDGIA